MAKSKFVILGLISSLCVSGCATTLGTTVGSQNRAAVEDAVNKQIVSTVPEKGAPSLHPLMSAAAIDRYLTDSVKENEEGGGFASDGGQ